LKRTLLRCHGRSRQNLTLLTLTLLTLTILTQAVVVGDLIVAVNERPLSGLSKMEVIDILKTTPRPVFGCFFCFTNTTCNT